ELLSKYLDPEQARLAQAILLGQREDVDRATNEAFVETGTVHILCIAGLHMGIVAWLLFLSVGWMPRRWAIICVMATTGAYMLLTTAQPPVIRATLLIWIVCLGMLLGRFRFGLNSLALAGLALLVINPSDLFRTGVQLSFVSVGILIWAGERFFKDVELDPLDRLIAATRPWPQRAMRKVRHYFGEIFWIGAVLWVAIVPLVMYRFHVFSPVSLVLNVVLIPVVTVIMGTGLGVLVFGAWLTPVAAMFGWICNSCLMFLDRAVKWSVELPAARLWVVGPNAIWLGVFYLALAAMILAPRWMPPLRWRTALLGAWCGVALLMAAPKAPADGELRCTFIAVGHGGGELLEMPGGKTLLYDAGKLGQPEGGAQSISCYLWSRGISHLDAVVISHADTDHYNSLPELLKRFSVGIVYASPVMFKEKSKALVALRECIERSGTKLANVYAGDRLGTDGGVSIDALHPPPDGVDGNDNANCVVLSVQYRGRKLLLTGDLGSPGMEMVMNDARLDYDVVQAPHHGSSYNDPEDFSKWTKPKWVFISGNLLDGNIARQIYADHGAKVLNTADCGAITATIDAEGDRSGRLQIETFHPMALADDSK
ncbi:MAG TPA: ComEC/Rec2 family competence protein, partial [Pirellulales bacterium]